ncbi:hypothetical protein ACF6ZU_18110 [Pseudomonas migulae]|uniref:hypothetical protein n=1 Tax=Pseudomonas migulae TaxID=78543 RepID=UPI0037164AD8
MNIPKELAVRVVKKLLANAIVLFFSVPAFAVTVPITAEFRPEPGNPGVNNFKNTTPVTGICAHSGYSTYCQSKSLFSINTPILFNSTGVIAADHTNPRMGAMIQTRSGWRDLQVTPVGGGKTETLRFRISGISSTYKSPTPIAELVGGGVGDAVAHEMLWTGGNWNIAPTPCVETGSRAHPWPRQFLFFWLTPADGLCAKTARFDIPELQYYGLDFVYELLTPNPLGMASGEYSGRLAVSLGPGGDIDMGDVMLPDDNIIDLEFTLLVDHMFKVEVPPGGNRIQLEPQGGWQAWLQHGRKPTRLFRDQTFHVWTSVPFKMQLECSLPHGDTCAVRDGEGNSVPLDIGVTLPNGMKDASGEPVRHRPLLLSGSGTERFDPAFYLDRKPGALHFEIKREDMEQMLKFAGHTYSGEVTVIWDSQI